MKIINTRQHIRLCIVGIVLSLFTPIAALAGKISDGLYFSDLTENDISIEVRDSKYTMDDGSGKPHPWKSTSELINIKKGIFKKRSDRETYYCHRSLYPKKETIITNTYTCNRNGVKKGGSI
jgi:hypothetical protein